MSIIVIYDKYHMCMSSQTPCGEGKFGYPKYSTSVKS
jgi:hypothetical protein